MTNRSTGSGDHRSTGSHRFEISPADLRHAVADAVALQNDGPGHEVVPYRGAGRDRYAPVLARGGVAAAEHAPTPRPAPGTDVVKGGPALRAGAIPDSVARHLIATYSGLPPTVARHLIASDPRIAEVLAHRAGPTTAPRAAYTAAPAAPQVSGRRTTPGGLAPGRAAPRRNAPGRPTPRRDAPERPAPVRPVPGGATARSRTTPRFADRLAAPAPAPVRPTGPAPVRPTGSASVRPAGSAPGLVRPAAGHLVDHAQPSRTAAPRPRTQPRFVDRLAARSTPPVRPFAEPPVADPYVAALFAAPVLPPTAPAEDVLRDLVPRDPFLDDLPTEPRATPQAPATPPETLAGETVVPAEAGPHAFASPAEAFLGDPVAPADPADPFVDEDVHEDETVGEDLPLGEILIRDAGVSRGALNAALAAQTHEGGLLGRHLMLAGVVSRRALYTALSKQWGAPLVDLLTHEPDRSLLRGPAGMVLQRGWLPWRRDGDRIVVATTVPPDETLRDEASRLLGGVPVTFRTTTDWDLDTAIQTAFKDDLLYIAGTRLAEEREAESARAGLRTWQLVAPVAVLGVIAAGLVVSTLLTVAILFAAANAIFLMNVMFKVVAGVRAPWRLAAARRWQDDVALTRVERGLPPVWPVRTPDRDLPVYTILVPAYGEANVIGKLIENLDELDYPKAKLDVLVLMEEDDEETIEAAVRMNPPEYVRLVVVPAGEPQTKPRACNYGLEIARGEYVVIYDAEDRPDPDQLRKAVAAFQTDRFEREHLGSDQAPLVCVQAALNYFNADYNVLTRMFSVEYAHWFDAMLPGLDGTKLPTPLGGTSNHFDTATLRELGAWDPWNVTEDADLGIRAVAHGYRVGSIASVTWEEACAEVPAWIRQRTRWIKGYMMTAAVVARHPFAWSRRNGVGGVLTMVGLIGGTPLAFMLYPAVIAFTLITYVSTQAGSLDFPGWLLTAGLLNMVGANLAMIAAGAVAAWRRYSWRIAAFAVLSPFYWVLHSVAAWRAALQMVTSPHHWEKTPHGLSEEYEDSLVPHGGG